MRFPIETIHTERLTLQPLRSSHALEMLPVLADGRLYEFTGELPPDLAALTARYRAQVAGSGDGDEVWLNWIVRSRHDDDAVGFIQATVMPTAADLAWLIGIASQRRGYGREAARAVLGWLIEQGVRRFTAHIHPAHQASQLVAAGLGMERSGESDDDGEEIWVLGAVGDR